MLENLAKRIREIGTNMDDTIIVGIMRKGIISNTIRERSHAVGLRGG